MTTFKLLHDAGFSKDRYRRLSKALGGVKNYGRNTPISVVQILDICGLYSAVWALRACPNSESFALLFAYDCAEHALKGRNFKLTQVLNVAQRLALNKVTTDEIFTARAILRDAIKEVTTPSDAIATHMLLKILNEPPAEAAHTAATLSAAYVDHVDSYRHYPPWIALQHEIEWQEHHFRELLAKELLAEKDIDQPEEEGGVCGVVD